MTKLRTTGPRLGGSNLRTHADGTSEASRLSNRSALVAAAADIVGSEVKVGELASSSAKSATIAAPAATRQAKPQDTTKAGVESSSFLPGIRAISEDERTKRKVNAIVSGLRSRYWGARGAMQDTFHRWDTDSSGFLDVQELQDALNKMGYNTNETEVKHLVAAFDDSGEGVVRYGDFVSMLCGDQKTSDALVASAEDSRWLTTLSHTVLHEGEGQAEEGHARRLPRDEIAALNVGATATSSVNGIRNTLGARTVEPASGVGIKTWAGQAHKKVVGVDELLDIRGGSLADVAVGVGTDEMKEALHKQADKQETDIRTYFTQDIGLASTVQPSTALAAGVGETVPGQLLATQGVESMAGTAGSALNTFRREQYKAFMQSQGHAAESLREPEPLLLNERAQAKLAQYAAAGTVPQRSQDRTLNAHAHVPGPQEGAGQAILGSEAGPSTTFLRGGAKQAIPGGYAYDPTQAEPLTGNYTIVLGTPGQASVPIFSKAGGPMDTHRVTGPGPGYKTIRAMSESRVRHARLMGKMPLEGLFWSEGTDSVAIAERMKATSAGNDSSRVHREQKQDVHGGGYEQEFLPQDHARASSRGAAHSLRDARLQGRTQSWMEKTGLPGPASPLRVSSSAARGAGRGALLPLAEAMRSAKERQLAHLGIMDAEQRAQVAAKAVKEHREQLIKMEAERKRRELEYEMTRGVLPPTFVPSLTHHHHQQHHHHGPHEGRQGEHGHVHHTDHQPFHGHHPHHQQLHHHEHPHAAEGKEEGAHSRLSERRRSNHLDELKVAEMVHASQAAAEEAGQGRSAGSKGGPASVAPSSVSSSVSALPLLGPGAPRSTLVTRLARAESNRTTYLIAPPPDVGATAAAAAEPPEWHYATATRLQQTQTPVPEQYINKERRERRLETSRMALTRWTESIRRREAEATAMVELDIQQRVARKRQERAAYMAAVGARKARLETALFGDPTVVQF